MNNQLNFTRSLSTMDVAINNVIKQCKKAREKVYKRYRHNFRELEKLNQEIQLLCDDEYEEWSVKMDDIEESEWKDWKREDDSVRYRDVKEEMKR